MAGKRVGVLALQGDVREHVQALSSLGAEVLEVRSPAHLEAVQGLVIPGGESSVIDKLSRLFGLAVPIRSRIAAGMPVYGTCAGLILLANEVLDKSPRQETFGGLDVSVRRNAFGSQVDSFETELNVAEFGERPVRAVFIRAPIVESAGDAVQVLARTEAGQIVAVEQGNLLGTSFHPEVSGEYRFHERFLSKVDAIA
ncbi:pyridoxal 5'-phosphate synthase glutaminase subunit PdxT [Humidisolicoccus flavus]|uniref:pyridoxal 5'-phosphate synthase glutaminase subunit PdxT n=1 Tax=Humidisolicoccus flavus TaxID=3111414 RepID=UPI003255574C